MGDGNMELPKLVYYETENQYFEHYKRVYCRDKVYTFDGVQITNPSLVGCVTLDKSHNLSGPQYRQFSLTVRAFINSTEMGAVESALWLDVQSPVEPKK